MRANQAVIDDQAAASRAANVAAVERTKEDQRRIGPVILIDADGKRWCLRVSTLGIVTAEQESVRAAPAR